MHKVEGWRKNDELVRNVDGSTTRKKLEADECVIFGPRIVMNRGGAKTNSNLNLYMEETLHITNVNRRKESDVKIGGRETDYCVRSTAV